MRLYIFTHNTGGFLLPTKNANSRFSARSSRVIGAQTANGFIFDRNAGNTEQQARLTHSGLYLFSTEAEAQALAEHLEALEFPVEGAVTRASAEDGTGISVALPPVDGNVPSLGNQIGCYLESYTLDRKSDAKVGGKIRIEGSFVIVAESGPIGVGFNG